MYATWIDYVRVTNKGAKNEVVGFNNPNINGQWAPNVWGGSPGQDQRRGRIIMLDGQINNSFAYLSYLARPAL